MPFLNVFPLTVNVSARVANVCVPVTISLFYGRQAAG